MVRNAAPGRGKEPFGNGNQLAKGRALPYIATRSISGKPKLFGLSRRL